MEIRLTSRELAASPLAFDRAARVARTPGDVIRIEAGGQAATRGVWSYPDHRWMTLASGVSLIMEDGATLNLDTSAERRTNGRERESMDLELLWGAGENSIKGGIFDGRGAQFGKWACSGLRFHGRYRVEDATIRGLVGWRATKEVFAISSVGATGGSVVRNVEVVDCLTDTADSYVFGIYLGATIDNGIESIVELCHVDLGQHGQAAFSSSFATHFFSCYGVASRWWYTDTGDGIARIANPTGRAYYAAFGSVSDGKEVELAAGVDRRIRVRGGQIDCTGGRVIEWWTKGGRQRGGISLAGVKATGAANRAAVVGLADWITFEDCDTTGCGPDHIAPGSPQPLTLVPAS